MTDEPNTNEETNILVTHVASVFDHGPHDTVSLDYDLLTNEPPLLDKKEDGSAFIGSVFRDGKRTLSHLTDVTLLTFDLDDVSPSDIDTTLLRLDNAGYTYILHSTFSHSRVLRENGVGRYRLIMFPQRNMTPNEHVATMEALAIEHNIPFSPESMRPAQAMFYPAVPDEIAADDHVVRINDQGEDGFVPIATPTRTSTQISESLGMGELTVTPFGGVPNAGFVMAILKACPAKECDRSDWLSMGHAVSAQTAGSVEGLALWDQWSEEDEDRYSPGEPERLWEKMDPDRVGGVSLRTLLAKKIRGTSVRARTYAHIAEYSANKRQLEQLISDAKVDGRLTSNDIRRLARACVKAHVRLMPDDPVPARESDYTADMMTLAPSPEVLSGLERLVKRYVCDTSTHYTLFVDRVTGERLRSTQFSDRWAQHSPINRTGGRHNLAESTIKGIHDVPLVMKTEGFDYRPGKKRIVRSRTNSATKLFNDFDITSWPRSDGDFSPDSDAIDHTVNRVINDYYHIMSNGRPEVAAWMKAHLAHLRAHPDKRIHVALSLLSTKQGVGKSSLSHLYKSVLGQPQVATINATSINQEKDTSFLSRPTLVLFGEEIDFSVLPATITDRIKEAITQDEGDVKAMREASKMEKFVACYVFTGNNPRMLGAETTGRRHTVIEVIDHGLKEERYFKDTSTKCNTLAEFYVEFYNVLREHSHRVLAYFEREELLAPSVEFNKDTSLENEEKIIARRDQASGMSGVSDFILSVIETENSPAINQDWISTNKLATKLKERSFDSEDEMVRRKLGDIGDASRQAALESFLKSEGYRHYLPSSSAVIGRSGLDDSFRVSHVMYRPDSPVFKKYEIYKCSAARKLEVLKRLRRVKVTHQFNDNNVVSLESARDAEDYKELTDDTGDTAFDGL